MGFRLVVRARLTANGAPVNKIKAYAIFDGGGVLGAALAGCFKAAEDHGLKFVGFGGTSAGSIIATLGAVGMSGAEIEKAVVDTDFVAFLQEGGGKVDRLKKTFGQFASTLEHLTSVRGVLWYGRQARREYGELKEMVMGPLGVDDGNALKDKLHALIAAHRPEWDPKLVPDVTFGMLDGHPGCYPLKIVASDVTQRKPVEFSAQHTNYGNSVLNAVRASTCYPFVFQPFVIHRRRLVDGGLSSNLPASLFFKEQEGTGLPVFAFDLVDVDAPPPDPYDLKCFVKDMMSTAIDAGDEFLRDVLDGVYHIPIPIPRDFDVLDFEISKKRRGELSYIGYRATSEYLQAQPVLNAYRAQNMQTAEAIQRSLQVLYGEPALYEPVLAALAHEVEAVSNARNVRVTIMLPTGRETRIVVYSHGMRRRRDDGTEAIDPDIALEIPDLAGASGQAWKTGKALVVDLEQTRRNPERWGLSTATYSRVPADRKAMLSFPIPRLGGAADPDDPDPRARFIGSLTLDSSTPLTDTQWLDEPSGTDVSRIVAQRLGLWLNIIQRLLLFDE